MVEAGRLGEALNDRSVGLHREVSLGNRVAAQVWKETGVRGRGKCGAGSYIRCENVPCMFRNQPPGIAC